MPKFGDVVSYVMGDETVNALVVQAVQQPDGVHCTVVYLDPSKASPLLSGQNVDAAIQRAFVVPLTEGKAFGWKDLPLIDVGKTYKAEIALAALDAPNPLQAELDAAKQELEAVKAELAKTTEGIDKQLQAIADENAVKPKGNVIVDGDVFKPADPTSFADVQAAQAAAKEAAPEATENPTSTGLTHDGPTETENYSETNTSEAGSLSPSPSPDQPSADTSLDSGTSEPQQ